MSDKWEPCPRCKSNKVTVNNPGYAAFIAIVICVLFYGLLGGGGLIIGIVVAFIFMLAVELLAKNKKTVLKCKDCEYKWDYPHFNK